MPMLYRHVVPNVPALTAGNGAPVYRGNAPSYQRAPTFSAQWSGDIDLSAFADELRAQGFSFNGATSYTAAQITAAASIAANVLAYGQMPVYQYTLEGVSTSAISVCEVDIEILDADGYYLVNAQLGVCIQWDANFAGWRWFVDPESLLRAWLVDDDGGRHAATLISPQHQATYAQALKTTDIRAGNGQTIPFVSCDTSDAWRLPALTGTSLIITAN